MDWCSKHSGNFRVQIGHAVVRVEGRDAGDAVRRARMALSREHPRLFDVIHRIQDKQFRVEPIR